jgi:hypothetical protein
MSGTGSAEHALVPGSAVGRALKILAGAAGDAIPLLLWGYIGFFLFYALTIIYGLVDGYALPTTAIFSALPHREIIARGEKYLPGPILLVGMFGASLGWMNAAGLAVPRLRQNELACIRLFFRWGLPALCLTFVFVLSNAGWNGRTPYDHYQYGSLAALVPNSDSAGYFLSPLEDVLTGSWGQFASRRPMAAGSRHLIMAVAGFSYVWTLLLQLMLLAVAVFAAARSIILWRGLWAGITFCAFMYVLARPFLPNTLTESLGLIWALLFVTFLVEGMRLGALRYAYLALVALTLAELTRMGSVLTVPAFVLWIALAFGTTLSERFRLFATGCVLVLIVLLIQTLFAFLYGDSTSMVGGNFAYTLCGLATIGGDWTTCPRIFAQEFHRLTNERDQSAFLYSKAMELIRSDPMVALRGMYDNVSTIVRGTPDFMVSGYANISRKMPKLALLALLPGVCLTLSRGRARGELAFWALVFSSMIASASIIFHDDGWRTMTVTWPLVALFLATGCTSPRTITFGHHLRPLLSARGGAVLISGAIALMLVAPAVTRIWPGRELQNLAKSASTASDKQAILFGRMVNGFLVVPDNVPLPASAPALHVTDFARLIRSVELEKDGRGPFLDFAMRQIPFAFVFGGRINAPAELLEVEQIYLAPSEILTGGRASAWQVLLGNRVHNSFVHDVVAIRELPSGAWIAGKEHS